MLRESVIRHVFSHQQALITLRTAPNQIDQSVMANFSNPRSLSEKLVRVRPREPGETLDSNKPVTIVIITLELSSVNHIGSLLSTLGYNQIAAESIGGASKLGQGELPEGGDELVLIVIFLGVRLVISG
jgi:hypothetical protein